MPRRSVRAQLTLRSNAAKRTAAWVSGVERAAGAPLLASGAAFADPAPTHGPTVGATTVSDRVPGVRFTQIASGNDAGYAIGDEGNTHAWGLNTNGQMGHGTATNSSLPLPITRVSVAASRSAGPPPRTPPKPAPRASR